MNFSDMCLSRSELKLLKELKKDQKHIEDCSNDDLKRLYNLNLCKILRVDSPEHGNPVIIDITPLGTNYLAYKKSQTKQTFKNCLVWLIGILVALVPTLLSLVQK